MPADKVGLRVAIYAGQSEAKIFVAGGVRNCPKIGALLPVAGMMCEVTRYHDGGYFVKNTERENEDESHN